MNRVGPISWLSVMALSCIVASPLDAGGVAYVESSVGLDDPEMEDARWFALDALPPLPSPVSIARHLIDATVARLRAA